MILRYHTLYIAGKECFYAFSGARPAEKHRKQYLFRQPEQVLYI